MTVFNFYKKNILLGVQQANCNYDKQEVGLNDSIDKGSTFIVIN